MTLARLIWRSVWFHARSHGGTLLGAAVGGAVLIGALAVGDSVRASLRAMALARLGKTEVALDSGDRLFRTQLALDTQTGLMQAGFTPPAVPPVAPALRLPAVATAAASAAGANHVAVIGVDLRFWLLANETPPFVRLKINAPANWYFSTQPPSPIPDDGVVLNRALAEQLGVSEGAEVVLRVEKPAFLSGDAPLAPAEDPSFAWRLRVHAVVTDAQFGRFGLRASQAAPFNAFVPLVALQQRAGTSNRANLLLLGQAPVPVAPAPARGQFYVPMLRPLPDVLSAATSVLRQRWQPEDAELEWRELPESQAVELRSRRVFLDGPVANAALGLRPPPAVSVGAGAPRAALPSAAPLPAPGAFRANPPRPVGPPSSLKPSGVLTYLVNELRVDERTTPYSMVTASGPPLAPAGMSDDEVLISKWLAEDLAAKPGDELTLRFYVVGQLRQLEERSASFRVRGILPTNSPGLDRGLMPDFPGLTVAQNCRDWDAGLPLQTERIREKDERYWHEYRGTPKALITLAAGQKLWRNRFGDLTAVRFFSQEVGAPAAGSVMPAPRYANRWALATERASLSAQVQNRLDPAAVGLRFEPVRAQALAASGEGQDFGQLFLGFSFFLMAGALLLMGLLFQFALERRAGEAGTLLALGFTPRRVRWLFWVEGGVIALGGSALGLLGGLGYARAMLLGLGTLWRPAVGGAALEFHADPLSLAGGVGAALAVNWLAMWLALRRTASRTAHELMARADAGDLPGPEPRSAGHRRTQPALIVAAAGGLGALALTMWALVWGEAGGAALFFGAGALLLLCGLALVWLELTALGGSETAQRLSFLGMGVRSATRRRGRSLAVAGLLAAGSFLVGAVGVFRLDAAVGAERRSSGTGGFALVGESTRPVVHDLNTAQGREAYGLSASALAGAAVVPLRVREGDEASCLNLNRAQAPRLLGVRPELLAERGAFTFAQVAAGHAKEDGWRLLRRGQRGGAVPAIGDQASIVWALGKKVGDRLTYTDERGRRFEVRLVGALANSMLQGNLLIAEDDFLARFPGASGYRMFLVDAPSNSVAAVSAELTRGLQDLGLEMTSAQNRLRAFNAVQNTYLGTFQALGGLGLLLGSVGLGVVVLRNVLERRGELALLQAVGFSPPALRWLVVSEHGALLLCGLAVGVTAALVAVLPAVLARGAGVPWASWGLTLAGVVLNGALWTWLAAWAALRGNLLGSLRQE